MLSGMCELTLAVKQNEKKVKKAKPTKKIFFLYKLIGMQMVWFDYGK